MKKRALITAIISSAIVIGVVTSVTAATTDSVPKDEIRKAFDKIKETMDSSSIQLNKEQLAEGPGFIIEREHFIFYKANVQMANELKKLDEVPTDKELLDVLIKDQLAIQDAKSKGIIVTSEEVEEAIKFQRETLESSDYEGENKELVQELMENRIRITGMTKDEFWASEATKKTYEDSLYIGKLFDYLMNEKKINNLEEFTVYMNNLLGNAQNQSLLRINE